MGGHGGVNPNLYGSKAKCGGPAFCRLCFEKRQETITKVMNQEDMPEASMKAAGLPEHEPTIMVHEWRSYSAAPPYGALPITVENGQEMAFIDMAAAQMEQWEPERARRVAAYLSARFGGGWGR